MRIPLIDYLLVAVVAGLAWLVLVAVRGPASRRAARTGRPGVPDQEKASESDRTG